MNKLIILCGFDRIGKDTLLKLIDNKNCVVYKQNNNPPNYRDSKKFVVWLKKFLKQQAKELCSINNNVVMARLFTSDYVYSSLFNRPQVAVDVLDEITKNFEVYQIILLFKDYNSYIKRCSQTNSKVEYTEEEFYKIQDLYLESPYNSAFHTKLYYEPSIRFSEQIKYIDKVINNGSNKQDRRNV